MLLLTLVVLIALIWTVIALIRYENGLNGIATIVLSIVFVLQLCGFYSLQPNEGAAITLFGNYKGTDRTPRPALGAALVHAQEDQPARAQRHRREAQG